MSYRPITDRWILARAKLKPHSEGSKRIYYGAYLGGFPERARVLLGATLIEPVLHVCGGMAKFYPYARGFGINDKTMDLNPECEPDFLRDCRDKIWPAQTSGTSGMAGDFGASWRAILIDPPYGEDHAAKYPPGAEKYPNPNELVRTAINHVPIGCKVGIIHFVWPACPQNAIEVASISVTCGRNNRERAFVVYERITPPKS
jgi:hypothetical protein